MKYMRKNGQRLLNMNIERQLTGYTLQRVLYELTEKALDEGGYCGWE